MNHTACSISEAPVSAPILTSIFAHLYQNDMIVHPGSQAAALFVWYAVLNKLKGNQMERTERFVFAGKHKHQF